MTKEELATERNEVREILEGFSEELSQANLNELSRVFCLINGDEKRIADLEKENAELKKELKDANEKVVNLACNQNKDLKRKINKAKEIIKNLMKFAEIDCREYEEAYKEAEQFVKE